MFAQTFQMGPLFVKVLISTCSTLQFRFGTSVCFKPLGLKIGFAHPRDEIVFHLLVVVHEIARREVVVSGDESSCFRDEERW